MSNDMYFVETPFVIRIFSIEVINRRHTSSISVIFFFAEKKREFIGDVRRLEVNKEANLTISTYVWQVY